MRLACFTSAGDASDPEVLGSGVETDREKLGWGAERYGGVICKDQSCVPSNIMDVSKRFLCIDTFVVIIILYRYSEVAFPGGLGA